MTDTDTHADMVKAHRKRTLTRRTLLAAGPLLAVAISLYLFAVGGRYVSTDNAYVRAGLVSIASNVAGQVVDVRVRENQAVKKGDILFVIDPEPFDIALREADAVLADTRLQIEALRAELKRKQAGLNTAEEDAAYQKTEFERHARLVKTNAVSRARHDEVRHRYSEARSELATIRQDIAKTLAELGGDLNIETARHPRVLRAESTRDKAALDLRHTKVHAMVDGVVARIDLQPGEYVQAGAPVFAMMAMNAVWVEANLKETELTHIKPGQKVTLVVDTYPDVEIDAVVTGISPATGSDYAILPAQNATGNWVKITQRVPVRIELAESERAPPLRSGMSVHVSIDTGRKHGWPFGGASAQQ